LKTGFFEYQGLRDSYREISIGDLHRQLILKFIEIQAVIISSIFPHVADHVWSLLGKEGPILNSRWPVVPEPDRVLISARVYLSKAVTAFRVRLNAYLTSLLAKGGKGKAASASSAPPEKPSHGTIWIAKTYPTWQSIILPVLQERFKVKYYISSNIYITFKFLAIYYRWMA